jgi:hypothetical protein
LNFNPVFSDHRHARLVSDETADLLEVLCLPHARARAFVCDEAVVI